MFGYNFFFMNIFLKCKKNLARIYGFGQVVGNFVANGHVHNVFLFAFGNHNHRHIWINVLSASRADYIAEELIKRGVSGDKITKTHQGGISDYAPNEANRHTKVVLHLK
jgi:hypothetical protein